MAELSYCESLPCKYESMNVADLLKRIREAERRAKFLFDHQKYIELLSLTEGLDHMLQKFYSSSSSSILPKNSSTIRVSKKDQLCLLYNKALIHLKNSSGQQSVEILLQAISEIQGLIDGQKIRLGFMDKQEEAMMQIQALQTIKQWQLELAKFYYYLAIASAQTGSKEVSMASALKTLDLIKERYEYEIRTSKSRTLDFKSPDQIHELLQICDIRDRLSHRKKLDSIKICVFLECIEWLMEGPSTFPPLKDDDSKMLQFEQLSELKLKKGEEKRQVQSSVCLISVKKLHCFSLHLLSSIEDMGQQDDQKSSNTRNMLLNAMLSIYVCKKFLPASEEIQIILKEYYTQFHTQSTVPEAVTIQKLMEKLNLSQDEMKENDSLTTSFSDFKSLSKINRSSSKKKSKKKSLNKDKRTLSKPKKKKSLQKPKAGTYITVESEQQKKSPKPKISFQAIQKIKSKQNSKRNHLAEAIGKVEAFKINQRLAANKKQQNKNRLQTETGKKALSKEGKERRPTSQKKWK